MDVAVLSLDAPQSGSLHNEEEVVISIRNDGKGEIKDIPVKCVVTSEKGEGIGELSDILAGPVSTGETASFRFAEKLKLSGEGRYLFTISAHLEGDVKENNNQKEVFVVFSRRELDAGVTEITSPVDGLLGKAESVCIQVKNYSSVDLYDIPVMAVVEYAGNDEFASQNLSGKVKVVKAGETIEYSFEKSVDMKAIGRYKVEAYTALPNDANPENDVCEKRVKALKSDVGVTEIIAPESGTALGVSEVIVRVKNFGEATIEQIPLAYKVGSMPQLGEIESAIAPGESVVYTFPVDYEFTSYKTYIVTAYTTLTTDADSSNDTCSKEVENRNPVGINDPVYSRVSIFPNPNNGNFEVSVGEAVLSAVLIYNMNGALVERFDSLDTKVYQAATHLQEGMYLVQVITSSGVLNGKMIVRK